MEVNTSPELFTPPDPSPSYATAASGSRKDEPDPAAPNNSADCQLTGDEAAQAIATLQQKQQEHLALQNANKGRKRSPPPLTGSDKEDETLKKAQNTASEAPSDSPDGIAPTTSEEPSVPSEQPEPSPSPPPADLKHFIQALAQGGPDRVTLMKTVPGVIYYRCRALFLYHKYGDCSDTSARKHSLPRYTRELGIAAGKTTAGRLWGSLLCLFGCTETF